MKVRWTVQAEDDREEIWRLIAADNLPAAARLDERFEQAVSRLVDFPLSGRSGAQPGTRELLPHRSYRLVYEVQSDIVWILALIHASRQWPPLPEDA